MIVSDNAKTFKSAAREIHKIITHPDVKRYSFDASFEWHFNLEKAPWWGGMFEQMIKSTKRCLRKMIGQAKFACDELLTAVVEVEAILNACPLTCVSMDDLEEPLIPSHLLHGCRLLSLPENFSYCEPLDDEDFEVERTQVAKRVKHLNNVLNHFWRRWRQEYLTELRECHRYSQGKESAPTIQTGDVVLLYDDSLPRSFCRVERLITGQDGSTHGAVLKVPTRSGGTTTLRRPVQLLYPLELGCKIQAKQTDLLSEEQISELPPRQHSVRQAATKARDRV